MKDMFSRRHPIVNMAYFTAILAFSMYFTHPVCLAASLFGALIYSAYANREKTGKLIYALPMLIVTALINPAFNHEGSTIIAYFRGGNPLTLESIVYGIVTAVMLITVISWFSRFNAVMTSDKLVYLFGGVAPALSMIFSMSLRFVPRFAERFKEIQKNAGCAASGKGFARRALNALSATITWALENAVETADSMKSRGYGLPGRTAFSIYRLKKRDFVTLAFITGLAAYIIVGASLGGLHFRYFPTFKGNAENPYSISLYAVYFVLCVFPTAVNVWEDIKWKAIRSSV